MPTRILSICLALVPAAAMAQDYSFEGLWRSDPAEACVYTGEAGSALRIDETTLAGATATCEMSEPVNVNDMQAVLYNMTCEGGNETFDSRAMLMSAADGGLYLVWDGYVFKYDSCTEGEGPAEPTLAAEIEEAEPDPEAEEVPVDDAPAETPTDEDSIEDAAEGEDDTSEEATPAE